MLSMGFCHRHEVQQKQQQELTQEMKQRLISYCFQLKLALIGELGGERYQPKAVCPKCGRELDAAEILRGFSDNVTDYTTACSNPRCPTRFRPLLVSLGDVSRIETPFYCPAQTLDQLRGKEGLKPEELAKKNSGVFNSALAHFGSLKAAFKKIGVNYPFEGIASDWEKKVEEFLGRLPDTVIANCARVRVVNVRELRNKLGIEPFSKAKAAEEIAAVEGE